VIIGASSHKDASLLAGHKRKQNVTIQIQLDFDMLPEASNTFTRIKLYHCSLVTNENKTHVCTTKKT